MIFTHLLCHHVPDTLIIVTPPIAQNKLETEADGIRSNTRLNFKDFYK